MSERRRRPHKMQVPTRWWIVLVFFMGYIIFTLHLVGMDCPDFQELAQQDENKPFVQSIQRMAESVNASTLQEAEVKAPLAKLGILFPIPEPPLNSAKSSFNKTLPEPKPTYYKNENVKVSEFLRGDLAPNNVFYVWCGRRWFEFQHYLSVLSVIRELRPDNIIFFHDVHPIVDFWSYNTWFQELQDSYPFFRLWLMDPSEHPCTGLGKVNQTFLHNLLSYRGGTYIHENTIIKEFPWQLRENSIVYGLDAESQKGFVMTKRGVPGRSVSFEEYMARLRTKSHTTACSGIADYIKAQSKPPCVLTDKTFYPKDIWDLENSFGRLARQIFYGKPDIPRPRKSYDELIPNIAHVIWIGGGEMDFLFYLCVLSLVYVAEVDMVYLHGDAPPSGHYWQSISHLDKVTLIYREVPGTVFGNNVKVLSHVTDIWRVDFMLKYGGIYVDTDTVFIKPLDREIRAYDAVGAYDWTDWNAPFPDTINFGVAIGKRNAEYWHKFQDSMKWFMDQDWSWNGLRQPYRIKERHPELVNIDPHLQIICFEALCHPTWWPNYHDEKIHHQNSKSIPDWRNSSYAYHWTLPTPNELLNEENLHKSNSMFAEIGKYILEKAGNFK